jgi:hypothetical protein
MKKTGILLFVLAALIFVFAGCNDVPQKKIITVGVWNFTGTPGVSGVPVHIWNGPYDKEELAVGGYKILEGDVGACYSFIYVTTPAKTINKCYDVDTIVELK